jgi:hypothetical protein
MAPPVRSAEEQATYGVMMTKDGVMPTEWSRRAVLTAGIAAAAAAVAAGDAPIRHESTRRLRAHWSDDLCESYAINIKSSYATSVYQYADALFDLIADLGVRTVRERVTTGTSLGAQQQREMLVRLAESGVRWHATVATLADWPRAEQATDEALGVLTRFYGRRLGDLGSVLHSLGGCNEIDGPVVNGQVDPEWAAHGRLMQRTLWERVRSDRAFDGVPVVGPSTRTDVTPERARLLGDLSAWSDWGNAHMYNRGVSPTKNIDRHLEILRPCFPHADRWFFTETGYNDSPATDKGATVSEEAAATYAIRGICDFFKRGSIYGRFELLDDPDPIDTETQETINATSDPEAHYGLVAVPESESDANPGNWRRKPEFFATRRFLRLMDDRGARPRTQPLDADIVSSHPLQSLVAYKRDGRHYLLLWRDVEVPSQHHEARSVADVPAASVTIQLRTPRPAAVYAPRYRDLPIRTQPPRTEITVEVAGDLVIVELG